MKIKSEQFPEKTVIGVPVLNVTVLLSNDHQLDCLPMKPNLTLSRFVSRPLVAFLSFRFLTLSCALELSLYIYIDKSHRL